MAIVDINESGKSKILNEVNVVMIFNARPRRILSKFKFSPQPHLDSSGNESKYFPEITDNES